MDKERLRELIDELKEDDEYLSFFIGMLERHLYKSNTGKEK